ncbi:glycosyltransferase [Halobacteroides halobius DSM 5150]|uniref:Glycosyltransferase n=1 Tax=Halobacteroides halobius (strain ATCC 35273 / DSM 5150 / MD-1) TaxID=748449 RepID=L0KDV2_HALHC|nr:glycosyltransferase family 4 protein [Halobacteroides halobius]AGB42258.1 glycosyltransferase [Halobacteroides halobius DSM 5150]
MKILFINLTPFYGGGEVYLKELINNFFRRKDFQNVYLASPKVDEFFNNLIIPKKNIFDICNGYSRFKRNSRDINEIIENNNIDYVFLNGNRSIYLAPLISKKVKKICTRHMLLNSNSGLKKIASKFIGKMATKYIDKVIVISNYHKNELLENDFCNEEKIEVVYNGINTNHFTPKPFNIEDNITRITQISRLEPHKGHLDLISAFERVYMDNKNIRLLIVGTGSQEKKLKRIVRDRNLEESISILGFRKDIKAILNKTDIFVLPSYDEGFPLSILEAMSMGVPIISTNIAGIPEMIEENKSGFLIKPGDINNLKAKIELLINDLKLRKQMADCCMNKSRQLFDVSNMVSNTLEALKRI